jgi:hypothetical protein
MPAVLPVILRNPYGERRHPVSNLYAGIVHKGGAWRTRKQPYETLFSRVLEPGRRDGFGQLPLGKHGRPHFLRRHVDDERTRRFPLGYAGLAALMEAEFTMIQQPYVKAATAVGFCLFIGRDHCGRWVVRDAQSLCGGLSANQKHAISFAMYERQRRPQSVIMLPNGPELDGAAPVFAPVKRAASAS